MDMITIPPGRVTPTDQRTRSSWPVELTPYRLAVGPITQAPYAQVTNERPSTAQGDRLLIESVSWWDAVRFCNAFSEREGLSAAYRLHADGIYWDETTDGYRCRPKPSGSTPTALISRPTP